MFLHSVKPDEEHNVRFNYFPRKMSQPFSGSSSRKRRNSRRSVQRDYDDLEELVNSMTPKKRRIGSVGHGKTSAALDHDTDTVDIAPVKSESRKKTKKSANNGIRGANSKSLAGGSTNSCGEVVSKKKKSREVEPNVHARNNETRKNRAFEKNHTGNKNPSKDIATSSKTKTKKAKGNNNSSKENQVISETESDVVFQFSGVDDNGGDNSSQEGDRTLALSRTKKSSTSGSKQISQKHLGLDVALRRSIRDDDRQKKVHEKFDKHNIRKFDVDSEEENDDGDGQGNIPDDNDFALEDGEEDAFRRNRQVAIPHLGLSDSESDEEAELTKTKKFQERTKMELQQSQRSRITDASPGKYGIMLSQMAVASSTGNTNNSTASAPGKQSFEDLWMNVYLGYDDSFFTSPEAKMQELVGNTMRTDGRTRKNSYYGVKANEENIHDIAWIKEMKWKNCDGNGKQSHSTFTNFCSCMGQIIRFAIAMGIIEKETAWKPGALFGVCSNVALLDAFLEHFVTESLGLTPMNKATQLVTLTKAASDFFRTQIPPDDETATESSVRERKIVLIDIACRKMMNQAAAYKSIGRTDRAITRQEEYKAGIGKSMTESDIKIFQEKSKSPLFGILESFRTIRLKNNIRRNDYIRMQEISTELLSKKGLLSKWCLNFVALFLMYGNGQRNQVYTCLAVPHRTKLQDFRSVHGGAKANTPLTVEIIGKEKTKRNFVIPDLLMDPCVFPFVSFHVNYVLPFMYRKHDIAEGDPGRKYLLLNTKTGKRLSSEQIRSSLRAFIKKLDMNQHITPMDLRAAYASLMVRKYVRGQAAAGSSSESGKSDGGHLRHLSKTQFIEMLAGVMNTSIEQIENIYASSTKDLFAREVAAVMDIVRVDEEGEYISRNDAILDDHESEINP